jgi:hypothetical protein
MRTKLRIVTSGPLCICSTRRPWEWNAQHMKALDQAHRFSGWFAMIDLHSDASRILLRTMKLSLNDGQILNVRVMRVHASTGYNRVEGNRRASRNGRVSDLDPPGILPFRKSHAQFPVVRAACKTVGFATQVRFVRKTHYLWSIGKDKVLKYWDCDKFEPLLTLAGHKAEIWALAISSYGDFVVTGGHDRSIRRWERTEEPFFLEEEQEKRLESLFEEGLCVPSGRARWRERERGDGEGAHPSAGGIAPRKRDTEPLRRGGTLHTSSSRCHYGASQLSPTPRVALLRGWVKDAARRHVLSPSLSLSLSLSHTFSLFLSHSLSHTHSLSLSRRDRDHAAEGDPVDGQTAAAASRSLDTVFAADDLVRASWVTLRARWVTLRARWVTLRARWVTLRARWVTLRARWVTLIARWVTLRARWVTLRARWVTLRARWVTFTGCGAGAGGPGEPAPGRVLRRAGDEPGHEGQEAAAQPAAAEPHHGRLHAARAGGGQAGGARADHPHPALHHRAQPRAVPRRVAAAAQAGAPPQPLEGPTLALAGNR